MKKLAMIMAVAGLVLGVCFAAQAATVNGATAEVDMRTTLTLSNECVLTFCPGHGMNGADAYVYTDVGGVVQENEQNLGTWPDDTSDWPASASTSNGMANGSVTVNTVGFDYSLHGDATVQALGIGDLGVALGDAYAWPDWLRTDHAGRATFTIDYSYTLDTRDTCDDAVAKVYMNAFLADHPGTNYLTAEPGWTVGYGSNPNTTIVEYADSIPAGTSLTVSDSVSWDVVIPNTGEPYNWWSTWSYAEARVDVEPKPIPGDADRDGDVDNTDAAIFIGNFTGPGSFGKTWEQGDMDGDGDVDNTDFAFVIANFTGPGAGNKTDGPDNADLIYNYVTGNVQLDASEADGAVMNNFVLQNGDDAFITGVVNFPWGSLQTDLVFEISNSDGTMIGFSGMWDLGDIFPGGMMDVDALEAFLTGATYVGAQGTGVQTLDLIVIPEPGTMVLLGLGGLGLLLRRRK